jgi:hypothetical protein
MDQFRQAVAEATSTAVLLWMDYDMMMDSPQVKQFPPPEEMAAIEMRRVLLSQAMDDAIPNLYRVLGPHVEGLLRAHHWEVGVPSPADVVTLAGEALRKAGMLDMATEAIERAGYVDFVSRKLSTKPRLGAAPHITSQSAVDDAAALVCTILETVGAPDVGEERGRNIALATMEMTPLELFSGRQRLTAG